MNYLEKLKQYHYQIAWQEPDKAWIATCTEFPSLSVIDDDPGQAINMLMEIIVDSLADMFLGGETPPDPASHH